MTNNCDECYRDGYQAGVEAMLQEVREQGIPPEMRPSERARLEAKYPNFGKPQVTSPKPKPKPKPTARNKAYSKAFKSIENQFKKKSGGWKKDGFKKCSRAANKMCKK